MEYWIVDWEMVCTRINWLPRLSLEQESFNGTFLESILVFHINTLWFELVHLVSYNVEVWGNPYVAYNVIVYRLINLEFTHWETRRVFRENLVNMNPSIVSSNKQEFFAFMRKSFKMCNAFLASCLYFFWILKQNTSTYWAFWVTLLRLPRNKPLLFCSTSWNQLLCQYKAIFRSEISRCNCLVLRLSFFRQFW